MLRQSFTDFIFATNTDGSGKTASCVRRAIRNGWSREVSRNWLSTDLYEREGNKISSRGILGCDVCCLSMSEAALFFCGCQANCRVLKM